MGRLNDDDVLFGTFVTVGRVKVLLVAVFCIIMLALVTPHAKADDGINGTGNITGMLTPSNESYVVVVEPTPIPVPKEQGRRIDQGGCVAPGETVDIAGLGWYTGYITYYGRYYDGYGSAGNSSVKYRYDIESRYLDRFFVDPAVFSTRYGYWYNPIDGDTGDLSGNDRLFYVAETCNLTPKETEVAVQVALNESMRRKALIANQSVLIPKNVKGIDRIIPKNQTSSYSAQNDTAMWVFGPGSREDLYDVDVPDYGSVTFGKDITAGMTAGKYSVVFVKPGRNTIIEEHYDKENLMLVSPFRDQDPVMLNGLTPVFIQDRLIQMIRNSKDDSFDVWNVELQDPSVEIMRFYQNPLGKNTSLVVIAGYTNANPGTDIVVQMDLNTSNRITRPSHTWHTQAVDAVYGGENLGSGYYRVWNVSFVIDYKNMFPGDHWLTVSTNDGGSGTVPFYVRRELADHYQPKEYIEFVDNSPFIPPIYINTTKIERVEVPGPMVTVTITPSPEQVRKAGEDAATAWLTVIGVILAFLYVVYRIVRWMLSIWRRM